jgi:hypothetical protein
MKWPCILKVFYPGGDVNITDNDGDTPLYTVETVETARFLVQHGAVVDRTNNDGISVRFTSPLYIRVVDSPKPVEHLNEDFNQVATYLQSTLTSPTTTILSTPTQPNPPSQHLQNIASEHLTSELMASVESIIQRAEAEGRDPEEEIRQVVSRTVLQGVVTGFDMTTHDSDDRRGLATDGVDGTPAKRSRADDGPG